VNKRAHKLFGKEDSLPKQKWIDDEFLKRRLKRKEKETRKASSLSPQLDHLLTDPYISMLANNISNFTNEKDDKSEQFTTQLLEFLQQQQQQHDFTQEVNIMKEDTIVEDQKEVDTIKEDEPMEEVTATTTTNEEEEKAQDKPIDYPIDAVLTLMQLNA
ncbi:hypothetical protein ABG067_008288, partial [Albugo candida]